MESSNGSPRVVLDSNMSISSKDEVNFHTPHSGKTALHSPSSLQQLTRETLLAKTTTQGTL